MSGRAPRTRSPECSSWTAARSGIRIEDGERRRAWRRTISHALPDAAQVRRAVVRAQPRPAVRERSAVGRRVGDVESAAAHDRAQRVGVQRDAGQRLDDLPGGRVAQHAIVARQDKRARAASATRTKTGRPNGARPSSRARAGAAKPASTRPRSSVRPALPDIAIETVIVFIAAARRARLVVGGWRIRETACRRRSGRRARPCGRTPRRSRERRGAGHEEQQVVHAQPRPSLFLGLLHGAGDLLLDLRRDRWSRRPRRATASTRRSRRRGDSA